MGAVREVAVVILGISLLTFIALFGHVPRLRNTPIGFTHRFLWKIVPRCFLFLDRKLTRGHLGPLLKGTGNYLINEKHPLIMAFYLTLVTGGIYMFVGDGWKYLALVHRIFVPIVAMFPYITIVILMITSISALETFVVHVSSRSLRGRSTAQFIFELQSGKHCIAKHDHHCVWINNCVGQLNTRHFLGFLAATNLLLTYGIYLSFDIIQNSFILRALIPSQIPLSDLPWSVYLHLFGIAIVEEIYIGAVFLLSALTGVLSYAFTIYHIYLIWAGTTTNETIKWSDWRDDIANGEIMIADPDDPNDIESEPDADELCKDWPRVTTQLFYRVDPANRGDLPRGIIWRRVEGLAEIDNIYDLGWRKNFEDVLWPKTVS